MIEKKPAAFHPVLLSIYPLLFLYCKNSSTTAVTTFLWSIAAALTATGVIYWLLYRTLKNRQSAAFVASIFIILFFSFGHAVFFLYHTFLHMMPDINEEFIFLKWLRLLLSAAYVGLIIAALLRVKKEPPWLAPATVASNSISIILVALASWPLVAHRASPADSIGKLPKTAVQSEVRLALGYEPDIYFFVPDGYSRADILKQYMHFDNTPFVDALRQRGFFVASKSTSNYFWTFLSLSSILNMQYVDYLKDMVTQQYDRALAYNLIQDNALARFLRSLGYRYIHFGSTFTATSGNPYADQQVDCRGGLFQHEYYRVLAESTWLAVLNSIISNNLASCHLNNFKHLEEIAPEAGPKFVFSHFILPHHPYIFDKEGRVLTQSTVSNQFDFQNSLWADTDSYVGQTIFTNGKLLSVIDAILAKSSRKPVIVIMSDHGAFLEGQHASESEWLAARFANFAAVYVPDNGSPIPDDLTAVNAFPIILNQLFGTAFEIRPRRNLYSQFYTPYQLHEMH